MYNASNEKIVYLKKYPKDAELPSTMKLQMKHFVD